MIQTIMSLTGTTKRDIIQIYIDLAIEEFQTITRRKFVEAHHKGLIIQMVVEKYNKRNNEGVVSTAIGSGLTTTFINGYSDNLKAQLRALKVGGRLL